MDDYVLIQHYKYANVNAIIRIWLDTRYTCPYVKSQNQIPSSLRT